MLPANRQPPKPPHITKHSHRHYYHPSFRSQQSTSLNSDAKSIYISQSKLLSSNKIIPSSKEKVKSSLQTIFNYHTNPTYTSFAITNDHHSQITNRSNQGFTCSSHSLTINQPYLQPQLLFKSSNDVSTTIRKNYQSSPMKFSSNLSNVHSTNTICSNPKQTHTRRNHDQTYNWKKQQARRKNYYRNCHFCTPLCMILCIIAGFLLAIILATILVGLLIKNKSSTTSSTTSTTTSTTTTPPYLCGFSCLNKTWISSLGLLAKWTFDGTFSDQMDTYNLTSVNTPLATTSGYINQALTLDPSSSQYLYTSYIPLISASFTIEAWLYPTGYPNPTDHSILGLCTNLGNNECLHVTIRRNSSAYCLYISFYGDNFLSNTTVPLNQWTHAAFTFDVNTRTMSIYQNGVLVLSAVSGLPLQGSPNNVTIGYIPLIVPTYGTNYFKGYIDHLTIFNRARSACEILDDATLATCYDFDVNPAVIDSGPNSLSSTSLDASFVSSGHLSDAISFNGNTSYIQINGLMGLGTLNKPFSISFWVRPYSLAGTLAFVSSPPGSPIWCIPFIGFDSTGAIVAQIWNGGTVTAYGPSNLTLSEWHHVVETWSTTNKLRLYVDNVLVASNTLAMGYAASGVQNVVRLANRPAIVCALGGITSGAPFKGDIDEFRVYSRELTTDDICTLYNY